jgi:hypothetical protein
MAADLDSTTTDGAQSLVPADGHPRSTDRHAAQASQHRPIANSKGDIHQT